MKYIVLVLLILLAHFYADSQPGTEESRDSLVRYIRNSAFRSSSSKGYKATITGKFITYGKVAISPSVESCLLNTHPQQINSSKFDYGVHIDIGGKIYNFPLQGSTKNEKVMRQLHKGALVNVVLELRDCTAGKKTETLIYVKYISF